MTNPDLEAQIAFERKEILNAERIPVGSMQTNSPSGAGRCHWCGQFTQELVLVEVIDGYERYKGVACCGGRHV